MTSAFCGLHTTHVRRREDAVIHNGREFVPTVYGQDAGNTVWVDSLEKLTAVGGSITFNEDQTEIWLSLPKDHKFSIQMFKEPQAQGPRPIDTPATPEEAKDANIPGQVFVHLLHGRDDPDEEMQDWGYTGPILGPFEYIHVT